MSPMSGCYQPSPADCPTRTCPLASLVCPLASTSSLFPCPANHTSIALFQHNLHTRAQHLLRWTTIDMGRKVGAAVPLFGGALGPHLTQCDLGRGPPPCQPSGISIQPFDHNRHGPKFGAVPLLGAELGPHLTQCCLGRG